MCPPLRISENTFYRVSIKSHGFRGRSGRGGKKFVTLNAGGDAAAPLLIFDAQHARVAADVNIARKGDLLRQSQDEFDRAAGFDNCLHHEVEAAEADIPRFSLFFEDAVFRGETNLHG